MKKKPDVIINGQRLSVAQAMTLRVALTSFRSEMYGKKYPLGRDSHGVAMREATLAAEERHHQETEREQYATDIQRIKSRLALSGARIERLHRHAEQWRVLETEVIDGGREIHE